MHNGDIEVVAVALRRLKQEVSVFEHFLKESPSGDPRFSLVNPATDPSLKISDTHLSDEGEYEYYVATNIGEHTVRLNIVVTGEIIFSYMNTNVSEVCYSKYVLKSFSIY